MQTELALGCWHEWDTPPPVPPSIVQKLGGGRSNRSFLLESAGRKMVLRCNAPATTLAGIGRDHEARIWRAAADAGIAPPLLHADPGGRFLVSTYIESDLPDRPQDDPVLAQAALGLLQRCHCLNVDAPPIDYAAHIETYWRIIEEKGLSVEPALLEQRKAMRFLLEDITASGTATGLCHHDPVVENFVGSPGHLYLVDWEYAARGLVVMDYAALAVEWKIDDDFERMGIEPVLLAKAKTLYRYLCVLWDAIKGAE